MNSYLRHVRENWRLLRDAARQDGTTRQLYGVLAMMAVGLVALGAAIWGLYFRD